MLTPSLRRLAWFPGQFLKPQDLQQQQAYLETLVRCFFRLHDPFCWGLVSLTLNQEALQQHGIVEIEQCEAIMPDGMIIRIYGQSPHSNARVAPRSGVEALNPSGKPSRVYLAIRRWQCVEAHISVHHDASVEEAEVPDCETPDNRAMVPYHMVHAQLIFDHELPQHQDCVVLPICSVQRAVHGHGALLYVQDIPPCLHLSAAPALRKMLESARDLLLRKGRDLETHSPLGGDVLPKLQLVNKYSAVLTHALDCDLSPAEVYGWLRQLVGEVAALAKGMASHAVSLPPYEHDQLWNCFHTAVQVSAQLLDALVLPSHVVRLVYDHVSQCYQAQLPDTFLVPQSQYYLAVKSEPLSAEKLHKILTERCKIVSRAALDTSRTFALSGLTGPLVRPPHARADYVYCEIYQESPAWQNIVRDKDIVVNTEGRLSADTDILLLRLPMP